MKSILQSIALLSAMILIASCDSSSGGGGGIVITPPAPIDAAAGAAVKGIIDGGAVTVTDANGATIGSGTVTAGAFSITYTAAAVAAGIANPITVTITGGTTVCDFVNPDASGNDCETTTAGTFVAFGAVYALPEGFTLLCVIPTATVGLNPTSPCNTSPASDIAAALAAPATTASALAANLAISGLIQAITGIDLGGVPVNEIGIADITGTGGSTASAAQLAVAAFAAAIVADQGAGETLADVIARFTASITIDANGNASGTGTAFAVIASAVAKALVTVNSKAPNAEIANAITTATNNAAVFKAIGSGTIKVPPAGGTGAVADTIAFVGKLSSAITAILATTGAEGSGADISVTEAFSNELEAVRLLSEDNVTKAINNLDEALKADAAAIDAGTKESPVTNATTEDGLQYVLTKDGDGAFSVTGVRSQWPKVDANVTDETTLVVITGLDSADADTTATSTATTFTIPAVRLVSTKATVTLQTFTGSLAIVNGTAANTFDSITFTGVLVGGTAGTSFTIDATFTNVDDSTTGNPDGSFTSTFGFTSNSADNLTVTFDGELGGNGPLEPFMFTIVAGSQSAIIGTGTRTSAEGASAITDVIVFSDGTASLTLTVTDSRVVNVVGADAADAVGIFTVGTGSAAIKTGELLSNGQINYTDGTTQFLPAIIF